MADVFVSYSRCDKARVAPLVSAIQARGWAVWWDPAILPGQEFDRQIDAELKDAAAVLVVWTPSSVDSRWVRGEARDAADRGILVPVRFEGATLPIDVRAFHTIDMDDASITAGGPQLDEMLHAIDGQIARHKGQPPDLAKPLPLPAVADLASTRVAICVLPFAIMGADPELQYLSDGITEDIITELSRWRFLAVRSRAASFRYRGDAIDVKLVARDLNVRFLVEGSVRRMGERLRITAQLIDTETGNHVWAEKFDRDFAGGFAVQDQVVRTIVSTLVGRVQVSHAERARRNPPNLAAYEYVLKGNALSWDDPGGAEQAQALFEKAIDIDPGYGMPHALLAAIRYGQWRDDYSGSNALLDEAYALARKAVELDENDSTCFSMLAQVCLMRRSFEMSLQHMRRAIEINPSNQWNNADMGAILVYLGEPDEALAWFKRAKEIDPYFDQAWYWRSIGQALMALHRYDEALASFESMASRHYRTAAFAACCQARLGNLDQARSSAAACMAMKPDVSIRHFMAKEPFRNPADAAYQAESLLLAGFPA
jgi:TolB-like protein/tetratricopeptide (TPR) repeat protein